MMTNNEVSLAPRQVAGGPVDSIIKSPEHLGPAGKSSPRLLKDGNVAPVGIKKIITSKEWVLPPRPKPGRKPSVDTPASKRKAQNRAAQRAFRERRATRVQELEERLLEVEKEREVKEMEQVNTINKLRGENSFLLKTVDSLKKELDVVRKTIESFDSSYNRSPNSNLTLSGTIKKTLEYSMVPNNNVQSPSSSSSYSVQQISPAPSADSPPHVMIAPKSRSDFINVGLKGETGNINSPNDFNCGMCQKEECLCEDVGLKVNHNHQNKTLEQTINEFKPVPAVSLSSSKKRRRELESEIDFTNAFSSKKIPDLSKLSKALKNQMPLKQEVANISEFNESSPVENCGFCSDDTPCVCREAAKEAARLSDSMKAAHDNDNEESSTLPPISFNSVSSQRSPLPVMHPGPSVEVREITNLTPGAVPTVVTPTIRNSLSSPVNYGADKSKTQESTTASGCTGNPGTCMQCQTDPLSTLFCTTVASKSTESSEGSASSPSKHEEAGSLISRPMSTTTTTTLPDLTSENASTKPSDSIFIPCADAYKTLSRHKKFSTMDFSTLVGKLTTRGMQVEVQSVANVLRELDRRLYS